MKPTALLATIGISALSLTLAGTAFAESRTTVNVNNDTGSNTVCINGECKTTEGKSESKVCVNGQCWDGSNGDVNYESSDGNTKVNISTNKESNSVSQQNNENSNTNVTNDSKKVVKEIEPTIKEEVKGAKEKLQAKREEAEKKLEETVKGFDIMVFIKAEFEEIQKFFTLDFLFGEK